MIDTKRHETYSCSVVSYFRVQIEVNKKQKKIVPVK